MKEQGMLDIVFVCHGNICRSPMAEYYFRKLVKDDGYESVIRVSSAATSREEIGNPVYPLAKRILATKGIGCRDKVACQLTHDMAERADYIVVMDKMNYASVLSMFGEGVVSKTVLLLDFADDCHKEMRGCDVADPWYTRDFERAWHDITIGCDGLLKRLVAETDLRAMPNSVQLGFEK